MQPALSRATTSLSFIVNSTSSGNKQTLGSPVQRGLKIWVAPSPAKNRALRVERSRPIGAGVQRTYKGSRFLQQGDTCMHRLLIWQSRAKALRRRRLLTEQNIVLWSGLVFLINITQGNLLLQTTFRAPAESTSATLEAQQHGLVLRIVLCLSLLSYKIKNHMHS